MTATEQIHDIGKRRAWVIWAVGLSVYILAVFHRSSLGVAGLLAADRFGIEATQLAFFTVLQLVVYAGMQIPTGVLLDRFGPRAMLLSGLALMTGGELVFAFATTFPVAVAARAVLGAGDAMIFVSLIRLVSSWFLVRQAPVVTQMTGQVGQLGAIIAAAPLSLRAHRARLDPRVRHRVRDRHPADGGGRAGGQGLAVPQRRSGEDQARAPSPAVCASSGETRAPGWGCGRTSRPSSR